MALRPPLRWTEYAHLRFTRRDPLKPVIDKVRTAELIRDNGLRGPQVYGVHDRVEDIDFAALPERFVLKPTGLNGKRGVMLLERRAPRPLLARLADRLRGRPAAAAFWDAMQGRPLGLPEIIAEQNSWRAAHGGKRGEPLRFIVEERILGENGADAIPFDYKVYVFAGQPRFVLQLDRNVSPPGAAFFDGDFTPMAAGDPRVSHGAQSQPTAPVVPRCAADILATAATLSRALRTPFISIDCYATPRGAVVGEITVAPGGPYTKAAFRFSEAFDRQMGAWWTEAQAATGQPALLYDPSWSKERRRKSGLPLKLDAAGPDSSPGPDAG